MSLSAITKKWPDKQLTVEFQMTNIISQRALSRRPLCKFIAGSDCMIGLF